MDLYAYGNINNIEELAKQNGIAVPRLRGYRLMAEEEPVSEEQIQTMIAEQSLQEADDLCRSDWMVGLHCYEYSNRTDRAIKRYLVGKTIDSPYCEGDKIWKATGINWGRINGKKRKLLKWAIRKAEKRIREQYSVWNRYAGQKGVLYIHSRMGGGNWHYYTEKNSITSQPWFLDRVDDYYDASYCDFYARIQLKEDDHAQTD